MHSHASLRCEQQGDLVVGLAEGMAAARIKRHRAARLPVGPQWQYQAATELKPGGGLAEPGPPLLVGGVVYPAWLAVAKGLRQRPVSAVKLHLVQLADRGLGCSERPGRLACGDEAGGGAARDQLDCQLD
jgi:hypothetical protein